MVGFNVSCGALMGNNGESFLNKLIVVLWQNGSVFEALMCMDMLFGVLIWISEKVR